jgi:RNA polymerase sigma factor (sigma-70 family)
MTTFSTSHTALDPSLDDRTAVSRYASTGDPSAFAALTQRYQHMVLATCRRVLRSQADAEDAAQETFLKLAKHAGVIRGNAAAWLHACAFGTATDMLRKQGSRARAEFKAGVDSVEATTDASDDARTWKELEPVLDEALSQLSVEEREAIVGHYLAGRPQKDLAREANVSPGTISRRIDAALAALQLRIQSRGVKIAGSAALATAITAGIAAAPASTQFAASLAKVGLAETVLNGKRLAIASLLGTKAVTVAACLVGMAAIGATALVALQSPSPSNSAVPQAASASVDQFKSVARPDKTWKAMAMVTASVDGVFEEAGRLKFGPERVEFVEASTVERRSKVTLKRLETKQEDELTKIRVQVEAAENVNHGKLGDMVNQVGTLIVRPKGSRLGVDLEFDGLPGSMGEIDLVRASGQAFDAPGPEKFAGEWLQVPQGRLLLDPDAISILSDDDFVMQKYKVLSWTEVPGQSRVETICLANVTNTAAIGKRFKLLLRKQGKQVSLVIHTIAAKQTDAWPSFEVKKGNSVRQATFTEE